MRTGSDLGRAPATVVQRGRMQKESRQSHAELLSGNGSSGASHKGGAPPNQACCSERASTIICRGRRRDEMEADSKVHLIVPSCKEEAWPAPAFQRKVALTSVPRQRGDHPESRIHGRCPSERSLPYSQPTHRPGSCMSPSMPWESDGWLHIGLQAVRRSKKRAAAPAGVKMQR
jgi:hypothetical protein